MRELVRQVDIVAANPVPLLLLLGETGTGKQVLARHFHERSGRAASQLVELNCSAIPESLIESELFGHERGAFSDARERKLGLVEVADGGTLFLDEVGDLGPAAQAKLLTFLEQRTFRRVGATSTRSVDVRIVAATNRDLREMVAARTFREDLWYRLSAIALRVPPLRERADDVAPLAQAFLADASRQYRRRWRGISDETLRLLRGYSWPGNVRELRAVMGRAALLHDDEILRPEHLPPEIGAAVLAAPPLGEAAGRRAPAATRDPDAGGGRAGAHPPRAGAVRRQPHAGGAVPGHHAADAGAQAGRRRPVAARLTRGLTAADAARPIDGDRSDFCGSRALPVGMIVDRSPKFRALPSGSDRRGRILDLDRAREPGGRVRGVQSLPFTTVAGFVAAVVALILISVLSYRSVQEWNRATERTSHTIAVLDAVRRRCWRR